MTVDDAKALMEAQWERQQAQGRLVAMRAASHRLADSREHQRKLVKLATELVEAENVYARLLVSLGMLAFGAPSPMSARIGNGPEPRGSGPFGF